MIRSMRMDVPRKGRKHANHRHRMALAIFVVACGPSVDDPEEDNGASGGGSPSGNAGDDGSGNNPGVDGGDDGNPYDECIAISFLNGVEAKCVGAVGVDVPGTCEGCSCSCSDAECDRDSDCPAPSGNVTPGCHDGFCVLRCDDDGDCPGDMRCGSLRGHDSPVCAEGLDDPLACAAMYNSAGWFDPCPAIADEASCEVVTSEYGFACKWATQSLYQAPSDDCVPVEVTESCIMTARTSGVQPVPDTCETSGLCAATQARVFLEDIGAGTVRTIAYENCAPDLVPMIDPQGNIVDRCDYSRAIPFPIVCGCACQ